MLYIKCLNVITGGDNEETAGTVSSLCSQYMIGQKIFFNSGISLGWVKSFAIFCLKKGTFLWFQMLLLRSWRRGITLNSKRLSLPDSLSVLLTRFTSLAWSKVLKSTLLILWDLAWSLGFLQSKWNFFNHLVTVIESTFTICTSSEYWY